MAELEQIYNESRKTLSNINVIYTNVLKQLEPDFIQLNRAQLTQGQKATGEPMPMYKGGYYERLKQRIGSQSLPHMDYKLSGTFHKSISAQTQNSETELFSPDEKAQYLEKRVKPDELYGVTEENLDKIKDKAIELLQTELRKALGI